MGHRKIYGILIFGVVLVLGYLLVANVMYNYQLSEFYQSGRESSPDVNYEWFQRHGISINGNATSAQVINVRDLLAYPEDASGSSPQEICRDVKSSSGSVTLSFIGGYAICCQLLSIG